MVWNDVQHASGPPIVGRLVEREAIGRLLDAVRDGFSGVLVLTGEPGSARPDCWSTPPPRPRNCAWSG